MQLAYQIRSLDSQPVAIAVPATFSQMRLAAVLGVDVPMLSDWNGTVAAEYGVRYRPWKGYRGVAKRSIFVVSSERRIRYRWVTDDALVEPDLSKPVEILESLVR